MEFINFLQSFGDLMIEQLWLPIIIWTLVAAPMAWGLYKLKSLKPIYHYHIRTALLLVLPLGLAGSYLMDTINRATESAASGLTIVIQNPISVSANAAEPSIFNSIMTPHFWAGAISMILFIGAVLLLLKLLLDFSRLRTLNNELTFVPLTRKEKLLEALPNNLSAYKNTEIAYSENTAIPFTYGFLKTKIVLPANLKGNVESLAMAVQHELVHIKNHDFLLNSVLLLVKTLFWFHPLVSKLYSAREEYREILCDSEVLATKQFSKKKYASLLFELAKRDHNQRLVLSMAVNPSSLKKRIQIMSNSNLTAMNFRSSFLITLFAASLLTLTISCTDVADDNITKTDIEQTQAQVKSADEDTLPLFIINGEEYTNKDHVTRLKTKYIKNIDVLKGKNATDKYGDKAENGALEISLNNPEKAFSDLKDENMLVVQKSPPSNPTKADDGDYYVTADEMPELVGGLGGLQQKITYPEKASEAGEEGRVVVQFIVDKKGNVENPTVVKGVSESLDEEALRVVKEAEFEPATIDGEPVRVQYSLPITYQLPSDG